MEIVTGALPSLLPKLADLLIGEYNLCKEVKGGIIFLQAELETMKAALEEISATPATKLNKVDKIWARDVRELSYDIEDKIDTFIVRCKGSSKIAEQHGMKKAIDTTLIWLMQPKIRRKIAVDIRDIKSRVEEVSKRRDRYKIDAEVPNKPIMVDPRVLAQYENRTELVGIDEARDEIIKRLMIEGDEVSRKQENIIVSIVGFGGLGKTTLASVVYKNLRAQFSCSAFVSVSQTPDMEKLFNDLLYRLRKNRKDKRNNAGGINYVIDEVIELRKDKRNNAGGINNVIDEIIELLQDKRYIIVVDDIWDISHWKMIKCALPNNGGCKIITTTRIQNVAEEIGGAYKMNPLCLDSSRILMHKRIFGNKSKEKCLDEELDKVLDRILIKCAGVPLAIITIASLLATKGRNKLDWHGVYNSIGTGMENNIDMENMRKVLSLSFYNLPSHLRTCLSYLCMFPEDYEIEKGRLIWMWIAEGFIQCGKQGQRLFEIGESYLNELINSSMVQPVYPKYDTRMRSCRVHDMVHDLICSLSSEENFIRTLGDGHGVDSSSQKLRRLSLQNDKGSHGGATMSMQQVRSLVVFSSVVNVIPVLSSFQVIRVLHLENCDLSHGYNLQYIGKLVHLRCLGLRSTKIVQVPEEIGNLRFLQILDISRNAVSSLPFSIVQLRELKCLYIDNEDRWSHEILTTPNGIGDLTSLEELSWLHIHTNNMDFVEKLGNLTELRVLHMKTFDFGKDELRDVLVECLHKLRKIETLSLYFARFLGNLDNWVGPQNLRSLQVVGYLFSKLPVWINHSHVQNLSFLKMNVVELEQEDFEILGRLPALRDLDLWSGKIRSNMELVVNAGMFPCLIHCKLKGRHYDRVVFRQDAMPRLKSLVVRISKAVVYSAWNGILPSMGFENLPSLMDVSVGLRGGFYDSTCVEKARSALRNMAEMHPNHPSISVAWG